MTYERINDSYREWLTYGEQLLRDCGIADPKTDAWLLLAHVAQISRSHYFMHMHDEMPQEMREAFEAMIKRRGEHVPLQHLTGEAWCYGNAFYVNEHVLIPRQDTEILIEEAIRRITPGMRVLDLCTGSGCVMISLLRQKTISGVASDISEEALAVARKNADRHKVDADWVRSDLFDAIDGKFGLITANPPYIPRAIIEELDAEVRDHEPHIALDGGPDGLAFYRRITAEAGDYLEENGWLIMEIGFDQGDAVQALMEQNGYRDATIVQDYAGLDRVVLGRK